MQQNVRNIATIALLLLVLVVGGYSYWLHQVRYPNTDDAYIEAHVINVASQVNGKVLAVHAKNQEHVTQGQLLFTIDPAPFQLALEKAQANLQNAEQETLASQNAVSAAQAQLLQRQAQLVDAEKSHQRIMELVSKGFYSRAGGDDSTRELNVTKQAVEAAKDQLAEAQNKLGKTGDQNAAVEAAKATLAQARLDLEYTQVYAPSNGQLAKFTLQPGQTVTAYESLFSLVESQRWWAMANMKETNMQRIRVGQKAVIHVDMYPDHPFHGIVTSISPGSGSTFSLLPAENATGNWVKVTQRFPVRIDIQDVTDKFPLRIGSSCTVEIDTRSK